MSYIRLADLQSGMGEVTSDQVAVEITKLQQNLVGVQANIANMQRAADSVRGSSAPGAAAQVSTFDANVRALRSAETALNQQITAKQQLQAQLQAQEAQNRAAMLSFAGAVTGAAANVGTAFLAAEQQRKAAKDEAKLRMAEANRPLTSPSIIVQGPDSGGMSTGAMVAIGVGAVVVIGGIALVAMRQQPAPAPVARNKGKRKR